MLKQRKSFPKGCSSAERIALILALPNRGPSESVRASSQLEPFREASRGAWIAGTVFEVYHVTIRQVQSGTLRNNNTRA